MQVRSKAKVLPKMARMVDGSGRYCEGEFESTSGSASDVRLKSVLKEETELRLWYRRWVLDSRHNSGESSETSSSTVVSSAGKGNDLHGSSDKVKPR